MNISIRLANDGDAQVISDICRVTFEASMRQHSKGEDGLRKLTLKTEPDEIKKRMITTEIFDMPSLFFLAQLGTNPVGVLELSGGHVIDLICVVPNYQKKGIGTKLFEEMRVYEREKVRTANFIAVHSPATCFDFFQSLGFSFEGYGHASWVDPDFGSIDYMKYNFENRQKQV
jgi:GNAT superfamily N-acetyltransferase